MYFFLFINNSLTFALTSIEVDLDLKLLKSKTFKTRDRAWQASHIACVSECIASTFGNNGTHHLGES